MLKNNKDRNKRWSKKVSNWWYNGNDK